MPGSPLPLSESFVEIPLAKKIAVIGGGVAGLSAAWHLQQCSSSSSNGETGNNPSVQVFEASDRLGGHAWTVKADNLDVDIGFMVFNNLNYPNLTQWFRALGVDSEKSDMSLSVSVGDTVWSSDGLQGLLLANPRNLFNLEFYRFLRDLARFHDSALQVLNLDDNDPRRNVTTAEYLSSHGYSSSFQTYYLYPMMAALWSASLGDVKEFPISQLIGFLANHQMLQIFHRPQWLTVQGRSRTYVDKVQEALGEQNVHCNACVYRVEKVNGKYRLFDKAGRQLGAPSSSSDFDHLIFACHAPIAADILKRSETVVDVVDILGCLDQIQYADNIVYVHSDPTLMPKSKKAWSSWNCIGRSAELIARDKKAKGAMEGAESGFGNVLSDVNDAIEGENGRFKAVYVT
jgi:cyclopropane-fatty-acyl-phospholipid synthase